MTDVLRHALQVVMLADADAELAARQAGHNTPAAVAEVAGRETATLMCEAFALDFDEVMSVAIARGRHETRTTLAVLGKDACGRHRQIVEAIAGAGVLSGIRIGLIVADEINRREKGRDRG